MAPQPERARLAALIAAAGAQTEAEAAQLAARLARCWPGGGADRTEPAALAWVRRWRPERVGAQVPACTCGHGRCVLCN